MRGKRGPAPTCAVDDCDEPRLIWLYLFANFAWTGARVALVVSCVPDRCETCVCGSRSVGLPCSPTVAFLRYASTCA